MPFETGFGQDNGLGEQDKEFEDIYEEEMSIERFQKMERRIMVQGIMVLVLVMGLAAFLALNFTTRLTKVADSGADKVNVLTQDVDAKVAAIMTKLDGAEKELAEKLASVSEKIASVSEMAQQVKALLDQATKTIQASKVDRSEVQKLLGEERAYTDKAVLDARVKTDKFKDSVLATLKEDLGGLKGELSKDLAALSKKQDDLARKAETLDENLSALRAGMTALENAQTALKVENVGFKKQVETLQKDVPASAADLTKRIDALEAKLQKSLQALDSLEKRASSTPVTPVVKAPQAVSDKPAAPEAKAPAAAAQPPPLLAPLKPATPASPGAGTDEKGILEQDLGE